MRIPRALGLAACAVTVVFWLACVAAPMGALLARAAGGTAALSDPDVRAVAWLTARQAALSTALAVALGLPLGLAAAVAGRRARAWLDALLLLPQGVPTVVAATAWVAWLGRSGWLGRLELGYSLGAVILAHVFFNAPWVALCVAQARRGLAPGPREAAATLGAGPWTRFWLVTWPELRWACAAAAAQVAAACSMSFALVLILGGGPPVETLETALYSRLRGGALDLGGAAACAAWEVALTLVPWALVLWLRGRATEGARGEAHGGGGASAARLGLPGDRRGKTVAWAALACAIFLFIPYLSVLGGGAASAWASRGFWVDALGPLGLSLRIAVAAGVGTLALAAAAIVATLYVPARARAALGTGLGLPAGLSVLVLGLGGWLAYGGWIDPFEGSLTAILALQITVFFPVAFRALWPLAQAGQPGAMEAAWTLGASPWRAFWLVDWPRWRAPVFSILALVSGMALGEVAAVSLFYSERLVPLPLLVSRWMSQYRFDDARAVSALLLTGAVLMMTAVSWLGQARGGGEREGHAVF